MRVLVTGGAGFIGSHVVEALLARGHGAGVIDDLSTGRRENVPAGVWFCELDILDLGLGQAAEEFAPDAVVHLAAQASVQASIADPDRDWAVNALGTRRVAAAAAGAGARRMLSASSAAVYGDPVSVPLAEDARTVPLSPYGRSKLQAESELADELGGSGVDFASLRFSNVYGPRQDALGEGGVVAIFLDTLARGGRPIVFGDGNQTRDFVYVADVARAIVTALECECELREGGTTGSASYNISTGREITVNTLAAEARAIARAGGEFEHQSARAGDIDRSALDPEKALAVFGWKASTSLESGLAATWEWYERHAPGDRPAPGDRSAPETRL